MRFPLLRRRPVRGGAVVCTPAKLNLFLEIHGRRADGFHEITTLMVAVNWYDRIVVRLAAEDCLQRTGVPIPGNTENLVIHALRLARQRVSIPPLEICLHKRIPPGRGLGGGSGNAAGMFAVLHDRFALPETDLAALAAEVGSDVPFFFTRGMGVGRGRGERVTPLGGPFCGGERAFFLLLVPDFPAATRDAYRAVTFPLTSPDGPISFEEKTFVASPGVTTEGVTPAGVTAQGWTRGLFNRLQAPVIAAHPELNPLVAWLEQWAPNRWTMTGSGSAFFVVGFAANEVLSLSQRVQTDLDAVLKVTPRVVQGVWA